MGKMPLAVRCGDVCHAEKTGENRTQENRKSSIQPETTNGRDKTIVAKLKNTWV
jgi:hypothetical protein